MQVCNLQRCTVCAAIVGIMSRTRTIDATRYHRSDSASDLFRWFAIYRGGCADSCAIDRSVAREIARLGYVNLLSRSAPLFSIESLSKPDIALPPRFIEYALIADDPAITSSVRAPIDRKENEDGETREKINRGKRS